MGSNNIKMIDQPDIIENILSRVPAKSIGRFRCVSKPWKALLTQPHFIKSHLNRLRPLSVDQQSLILVGALCELGLRMNCWRTNDLVSLFTTQLKNNFNHNHTFDEMTALATSLSIGDLTYDKDSMLLYGRVASCDGLTISETSGWKKEKRVWLINPTTEEVKLLPESPYAFDPEVDKCTMFGVGYDSVSDDYKVVYMFSYDISNDLNSDTPNVFDVFVNVYSVKNGTWKRAANSPYNHNDTLPTAGVFVNGYIHWLATRCTYSSPCVIVAFDLVEEKFFEVPLPDSLECCDFVFPTLSSLGGNLSTLFSMRDITRVWVMKEYGVQDSWIEFEIANDTNKTSKFRPICILGEEQVVLEKKELEALKQKLVVYNLKDKSFKDIVVQGIPIPDKVGVGGTFIESLVSPHCSVEATREE